MKALVLSAVGAVALCLFCGTAVAEGKKKKPEAGATAAGKVKAVDEKAATITLEGKKPKDGGAAAPDQTFAIAKDVKVTEGKEVKTLADVKAGTVVTLALTEDKKAATAIVLPAKGKGKTK